MGLKDLMALTDEIDSRIFPEPLHQSSQGNQDRR